MAFSSGDRLGAYEVLSTLGAGGMGVVYRARDTRLERDVAIKTLPDDVAADPERRARFEREARALAALSHPNIAAVFGFEQAGSAHLLVMELVEGETLADWIARGPIAVDRAVPLFLQIAAGIEAAHAKGIIHRDLKPANVKIAGSASAREIKPGAVKILDFGLAKALAPEGEARAMTADATHSPTLTMQATMRGELLGTAGYMSPEQAEGEPADERADIWAFGVCLLEALTGRPVFRGSNASRILASVLKDEPDLAALPPATPAPLRRLLRRCLEKDRDRRLRDIADARLELEEALAAPAVEASPVPAPASRHQARWWMAVLVALLLGTALGLVADRSLSRPAKPASVERFIVNPSPNAVGGLSRLNEVALTTDGKTVVYAAQGLPERVLFARRIDQLESVAIRGVEPLAYGPFLSPDGRWVGYGHQVTGTSSGGTLRKIALEGGASVEIAKTGQFAGASWGPGDVIVFGQLNGPMRRVSAAGGEARDVIELRAGEVAHRFPEFLPGGRIVLFTVVKGIGGGLGGLLESTSIDAVTLATGERKTLVQGGSQPQFLPPGYLLYAVDSTLYAVAFDPERLELRGGPVPVQQNISWTWAHATKYAISQSGALAYVQDGGIGTNLVLVDRDGHEELFGAPLQNYMTPRVSPDGKRVVSDQFGEKVDVWLWDVERAALSRPTVSDGQHFAAMWSRDGRTIYHSAGLPNGNYAIVGVRADGSGDPFTVSEQPVFLAPASVTADGAGLVAVRGFSRATTGPFEIVLLDTSGKADPRVLLSAVGRSFGDAELSPDERFLAYVSNESGTSEVYVRPYPSLDSGKYQVSSGGGSRPLWSHDGKEIFFLDSSDHITAAPVATRDGSLQIGRAEVLLQTPYPQTSPGRTFDLMPDGKRFLLTKAAATREPGGRVIYVQNWLDEVRRRVPSP